MGCSLQKKEQKQSKLQFNYQEEQINELINIKHINDPSQSPSNYDFSTIIKSHMLQNLNEHKALNQKSKFRRDLTIKIPNKRSPKGIIKSQPSSDKKIGKKKNLKVEFSPNQIHISVDDEIIIIVDDLPSSSFND
ncbi:hypothetical protein pb186bvf_002763 [Paramecium bursaria]